MLKLQNLIVAGAVAGFALISTGSAFAQGTGTGGGTGAGTGGAGGVSNAVRAVTLKVNDADPNDLARIRDNGRLRKTDEEFTNEMGVVKFFEDGKGVYVEMRTGALPGGQQPIHRMQGACTPISMVQGTDGKVKLEKRPGERFISDNDGNEYRNFNKPELMLINGGKNMLVTFNYQPEGTNDTRRYAKVLDSNCQEVPVRNANGELRKQILVMAKNNDDCDMHQSGDGPCDIASDVNGTTHLACWAGCNGNGRDDGWLNDYTVACTNGAAGSASECQITKNFDISLARREERSRGRCSIADEDPNTAICTWTEGNNQPQRDGTWIAAVDLTPGGQTGADVQSRLLWKEQLDGRNQLQDGSGRDTYSVRAKHTRIVAPGADGKLVRTNQIFFSQGQLRGRNRNNEKGGTYRAQDFAVIKATRTGMQYINPKSNVSEMLLGIDGTHLSQCGAVVGNEMMPGFTLLQGSHNGGGASTAVVKTVGYDTTNGKFVDFGTYSAGAPYDRHIYSNYLGNNPGNQGRNFAGCTLVKNPFFGQNGNAQQYFIAHALTGKSPETADKSQIKPSSYVSLLPIAGGVQLARRGLEAEPKAGCSAMGGVGTDGGLMLVGLLGMMAFIRRRRA